MEKKVEISGEKTVYVAKYNRKAAKNFLDIANTPQDGRFYSCQASLVFSAFTHEAFMNTVGPMIISAWSEHDRKDPKKKLKRILKELSYKPDFEKRPYSTLKKLFEFRNDIAHGRVYKLKDVVVVPKKDDGDYLDAIQTKWESYCTVSNAQNAYSDVEMVAKDILVKADITFPGQPFGSLGSASYSVNERA